MSTNTNNAMIANNSSTRSTSAYETSVTLTYEGTNITFLKGDNVMVNATQMAKPFGKRPTDWLKLPSTKEFIQTLSEVRKSHNTFIETFRGVYRNGRQQGTWMHQDVALEFARWLSPAFAIWTNDQIKSLLTTGVATINDDDETIANAMLILQKRLEASKQRLQMLEGQNQIQKEQIKELAPKAEYTDSVLQSLSTYTMTQVAKDLGFSSVAKFTFTLKSKGIMFKQSGQWLLTSKYAGNDYTKTRTFHYTDSTGIDRTNMITVWTEKGREFLHSLMKGGKI